MRRRRDDGAARPAAVAAVMALALLGVGGCGRLQRGEWYDLPSAQFRAKVDALVAARRVGEDNGVPVVAPEPGEDVYLLARRWSWSPIAKLRRGVTYRLHVSSLDLQHGFWLQPISVEFHVSPDHVDVVTITPHAAGVIHIRAVEYCGMAHPEMVGTILVE